MGKRKSFSETGFYEYENEKCRVEFNMGCYIGGSQFINVSHHSKKGSSTVNLHDIIYFPKSHKKADWIYFDKLPISKIIKIINQLSLGKRTIELSYHKKGPYCKGGPSHYKNDTNNLKMITIGELMDSNVSDSDSIDIGKYIMENDDMENDDMGNFNNLEI